MYTGQIFAQIPRKQTPRHHFRVFSDNFSTRMTHRKKMRPHPQVQPHNSDIRYRDYCLRALSISEYFVYFSMYSGASSRRRKQSDFIASTASTFCGLISIDFSNQGTASL